MMDDDLTTGCVYDCRSFHACVSFTCFVGVERYRSLSFMLLGLVVRVGENHVFNERARVESDSGFD